MKLTKTESRAEMCQLVSNVEIIFHHFGIDGFTPDHTRKLANQDEKYRVARKRVLDLEKAVIHDLRKAIGDRLLNETKVKRRPEIAYPEIHKKIIGLVA